MNQLFASHRSPRRKTVEYLSLLLALMVLLNVVQLIAYARMRLQTTHLTGIYSERAQLELDMAGKHVIQLSRTGSSSTTSQLAQVRQHVYALEQLNALTASLYGPGRHLIDPALIKHAISCIDACDQKIFVSQSIDEPLSRLRTALDALVEAVPGGT